MVIGSTSSRLALQGWSATAGVSRQPDRQGGRQRGGKNRQERWIGRLITLRPPPPRSRRTLQRRHENPARHAVQVHERQRFGHLPGAATPWRHDRAAEPDPLTCLGVHTAVVRARRSTVDASRPGRDGPRARHAHYGPPGAWRRSTSPARASTSASTSASSAAASIRHAPSRADSSRPTPAQPFLRHYLQHRAGIDRHANYRGDDGSLRRHCGRRGISGRSCRCAAVREPGAFGPSTGSRPGPHFCGHPGRCSGSELLSRMGRTGAAMAQPAGPPCCWSRGDVVPARPRQWRIFRDQCDVGIRGTPDDYQRWVDELGCDGWGWAQMLATFRSMEDDVDYGGESGTATAVRFHWPGFHLRNWHRRTWRCALR